MHNEPREPHSGPEAAYLFPIKERHGLTIRSFSPEKEEIWPELVNALKEHRITTPLIWNAPELQLETLFYLAARECDIPVCSGSVYNLPLALTLIETMRPDALVSEPDLAHILLTKLNERKVEPAFKLLFLIGKSEKGHDRDTLQAFVHSATILFTQHPLIT